MTDRPRTIVVFLAPTLCLLAPLLVFLTANHYPLLTPEVMYLVGFASVPGLIAVLLTHRFGLLPATVITTLCLCLAVLMLYNFVALYSVAAALLAIVVGARLVRDRATVFVCVAAAAHLASTLFLHVISPAPSDNVERLDAGSFEVSPRDDLPPIVHLVLDEFGGLASFPLETESGREAHDALVGFAQSEAFTYYPNAFSQYLKTRDSVPNLLNFSASERPFAGPHSDMRLRENAYFKHLSELGYSIDVYQADYINFCMSSQAKVRSCRTYPMVELTSIRQPGISAWQRALFLRRSAADASATLRMLRLAYLRLEVRFPILPDWESGNGNPGPLSSIRAIGDIEDRLATLGPGEMVFAHLLIPHYPYVYEKDCSIRPRVSDWLNRVPFHVAGTLNQATGELHTQNDEASRTLRYEKYLEQVVCTQSMLEDLFATLKKRGVWEQAIVIVHGDHGPRIFRRMPNADNINELNEDDYRDAFSALFMARSPFLTSGANSEALPLPVLLARALNLPEPDISRSEVFVSVPDKNALLKTPLRGFASN